MWTIEVNESCIGSGVCAGTAPRHFTLGDDNRSHPPAGPVDENDAILDAAASCPVEAITITDTTTHTPVTP